jgi:large subunit ribosomal protein L24e
MIFRKVHKKGLVEDSKRRKTRKQQKVTRAIVGASVELINKRKNLKPEQRQSQREAALRKAKEEKKKVKAEKTAKTAAPKAPRQKTQKTGKGR